MKRQHLILGGALCALLMAAGCTDNTTTSEIAMSYADPGKPVKFTDFTPKTGAAATRIYITGDNFGTDPDKIRFFRFSRW